VDGKSSSRKIYFEMKKGELLDLRGKKKITKVLIPSEEPKR
jgi:hypothetical protein